MALSTKQFGKLTVIGKSQRKSKNRQVYYECICECGKTKEIREDALKLGMTKTCGHCNTIPSKEYNGYKFAPSGEGYYKNRTVGKLHRYIWEQHNGPIPEGYHIHHKDGNKENNDVSNLELISASTHQSLHRTGAIMSKESKLKLSISQKTRLLKKKGKGERHVT